MSNLVERLRAEIDTSAEPDPNGTLAAKHNWWKDRCDKLENALEAVNCDETQHDEIERLHSWEGIMSLIDEHYPPAVQILNEGDDTGPRILRLIREIDKLRLEREAFRVWFSGEIEEFKPEFMMPCAYCAEPLTGGRDAILSHVYSCPDNPLVAEIKRLRGMMIHCDDCGGTWLDDGINTGCHCTKIKRLRGDLSVASALLAKWQPTTEQIIQGRAPDPMAEIARRCGWTPLEEGKSMSVCFGGVRYTVKREVKAREA